MMDFKNFREQQERDKKQNFNSHINEVLDGNRKYLIMIVKEDNDKSLISVGSNNGFSLEEIQMIANGLIQINMKQAVENFGNKS